MENEKPEWDSCISLPGTGTVILAVPVYGSAHHTTPGAFLRWDTWTQDLDCDWDEEQDIGWRVNDATLWTEQPSPPGAA